MLPHKNFEKLGTNELVNIMRFLTYRDALRLLSCNHNLWSLKKDPIVDLKMLQAHFDIHLTESSYREYHKRVFSILETLTKKAPLYGLNQKEFILTLPNRIYRLYKNVLRKYSHIKNIEQDVDFLTAMAIQTEVGNNYINLGGACFYHTVALYALRKEPVTIEPIKINHHLTLYPYVALSSTLLLADLENNLGLGNQQRYLIVEKSGDLLRMVNVKEDFLRKVGQERQSPSPGLKYYEFYGTGGDNVQSDCTTRGIRVRAAARPIYTDQRSSWKEIVFSYEIRISDGGVSAAGAKLLSREWFIEELDEEGNRSNYEQVRGQGVIGLFPYIKRGCQDFKYESCSIVSAHSGRMWGNLIFKDVSTNEVFKVQVKPFRMTISPDRMVEYNVMTKQLKIVR